MAEKSAVLEVKPAPQVKELEAVQVPLKSDISYLDRMRRDPSKPSNTKKHLYWYGMLPASGANTWNGKTADENWNREEGLSIWAGKCRWFQNLTVGGTTFEAFSGKSQRSPVQSPNQPIANGITMAGAVAEYTDEEVQAILFNAAHTMVRDPKDPNDPGGPNGAVIYRLIEVKPGEWVHENMNPSFPTNNRTSYNSETDFPASDFVYFMRIKDRFQQHDVPSLMRNPPPSLSGR
jgi:hypothetical protein